MSVTETMNEFGPLAGVKIVELSEWVAAPASVRLLSEMGAEVLKVEPPHGDAQRTQGPGFGIDQTDTEDPTMDLNNTNKNWLCINLKTPEGMKFFKELLATADIFVHSLRDRALVGLGLDYATLSQEFPRLIWAQNRGYGEFGAESGTPGFDAVCWAARGGVAASFPEAGSSPAIPPQAFGDYNHALAVAGGVLAALFNRTRTGRGEKVVANLYHSAIWGGNIGIMATQFGAAYPKSRTRVPNPFNNTYRTANGEWVLICMPQYDKYFTMMMEIFGLGEYANDPDISNLPALKASGKAGLVVGLLEESFATKTFEEWSPILRDHQVPHQKLYRYEDILQDDEAYDNDALRVVEYKAFGTRSIPTSPVRFGSYGDPPMILSKPLGYHTAEYLKRHGYTAEQTAELEASGAVRCWHGEDLPDRVFASRRQAAGEAERHW